LLPLCYDWDDKSEDTGLYREPESCLGSLTVVLLYAPILRSWVINSYCDILAILLNPVLIVLNGEYQMLANIETFEKGFGSWV